jgi:hypothetical protein
MSAIWNEVSGTYPQYFSVKGGEEQEKYDLQHWETLCAIKMNCILPLQASSASSLPSI